MSKARHSTYGAFSPTFKKKPPPRFPSSPVDNQNWNDVVQSSTQAIATRGIGPFNLTNPAMYGTTYTQTSKTTKLPHERFQMYKEQEQEQKQIQKQKQEDQEDQEDQDDVQEQKAGQNGHRHKKLRQDNNNSNSKTETDSKTNSKTNSKSRSRSKSKSENDVVLDDDDTDEEYTDNNAMTANKSKSNARNQRTKKTPSPNNSSSTSSLLSSSSSSSSSLLSPLPSSSSSSLSSSLLSSTLPSSSSSQTYINIKKDGLPFTKACIKFDLPNEPFNECLLKGRGGKACKIVFDSETKQFQFTLLENLDKSGKRLADLHNTRESKREWIVPYSFLKSVALNSDVYVNFKFVPSSEQTEEERLEYEIPFPICTITFGIDKNQIVIRELEGLLNPDSKESKFISVDEDFQNFCEAELEGLEKRVFTYSPFSSTLLSMNSSSRSNYSSSGSSSSSSNNNNNNNNNNSTSRYNFMAVPSSPQLNSKAKSKTTSLKSPITIDDPPSPFQLTKSFETSTDFSSSIFDEDDQIDDDKDFSSLKLEQNFIYETPGSYLEITNGDLARLRPREFLNDVIIEFYIKYLINDVFTPEQNNDIFIYNSFFFNKLNSGDKVLKQSEKEMLERYKPVRKWSGDVDIFSKKYLFIPINLLAHWLLLVVCHAGEYAKDYLSTKNDSNSEEHIVIDDGNKESEPCLIFFDSLKTRGESNTNIEIAVKNYLTCEWIMKKPNEKKVNFNKMKTKVVHPPQQRNSYDCGIYLLQYLEKFVKAPSTGINATAKWFPLHEVKSKREKIQRIIVNKANGIHTTNDTDDENENVNVDS